MRYRYARAWLEGRRVDIVMSDVWTTLAILFAALEIATGIDSSELHAPLRAYPSMLYLPGNQAKKKKGKKHMNAKPSPTS